MLRRPSERSLADRGVEGRTRVSRVFNQQTHGGFLSHGTQIKNWSILKFFFVLKPCFWGARILRNIRMG